MTYYDPRSGIACKQIEISRTKLKDNFFGLVVDEPQNHFGLKKNKKTKQLIKTKKGTDFNF